MKLRDPARESILPKSLCTLRIAIYGIITSMAFVAFRADSEEQGLLKSEFVYATNSVPFPECHASTVVETQGHLAAAWFGGTREGSRDVGIWSSRLKDGVWTPPKEVAD